MLAEHKELHGIWTVLTQNRKGYSNHPEVKRWKMSLGPLYLRHEAQIDELTRRGFKHASPLNGEYIPGMFGTRTPRSWSTKEEQYQNLKRKGCACRRELLRKRTAGFVDPLSAAVVAMLMLFFYITGKTDQAKAKGLVAQAPKAQAVAKR